MSHFSPYGGHVHDGAADGPRFLHLMLPWAVGLVVTVMTQLTVALLVWDVIAGGDPESMVSVGRTVLLLHLPSALCFALGTWAAAAVHRSPSRDAFPRHCAAAFAPPVAVQLLVFVTQGDALTGLTFLTQLAVLLTGCVLGFLVNRMRQR
jgi:hypothetical protein